MTENEISIWLENHKLYEHKESLSPDAGRDTTIKDEDWKEILDYLFSENQHEKADLILDIALTTEQLGELQKRITEENKANLPFARLSLAADIALIGHENFSALLASLQNSSIKSLRLGFKDDQELKKAGPSLLKHEGLIHVPVFLAKTTELCKPAACAKPSAFQNAVIQRIREFNLKNPENKNSTHESSPRSRYATRGI